MKAGFFQSDTRTSNPLERLARLDAALAAQPLDLVVCPELFLSGFGIAENVKKYAEPEDGPFAEAMAEVAARNAVSIVYGYPELADGAIYNSALCIAPSGKHLGNHRKRLFPSDYERDLFVAGDDKTIFTLDSGVTVGLLVCYEIEFPEAARACARAGADIIVAPTACGIDWSIVSRKMVPIRAMENGVFVIYSNHVGREGELDYLGDSCVISPMGEDLARAGREEELHDVELDMTIMEKARKRLPYLDDHHEFL
ncbi:MAG: hydrolase [Rhodospirillales bacterium]|jgi:5-aminopentanamidase|nr:hydrolase [Rhodospirillales bacterium]